jgi:ribosomal protein L35AE/L33A
MSDYVSINMAGEGVFDYEPITVALTNIMKALHWLTLHPHYFKKIGLTSKRIAKQNDSFGIQGNLTWGGRSKHRLLCGGNLQPYQAQTSTSQVECTRECRVANATHKKRGVTSPSSPDETKLYVTNESIYRARATVVVNGEVTWTRGRSNLTKVPQELILVPDDPSPLEPRTWETPAPREKTLTPHPLTTNGKTSQKRDPSPHHKQKRSRK